VRHSSWAHEKKAREILEDNNIALCISDTAGRYPYIEEDTADFLYIRLHGSKKIYSSEYSEEELQTYAEKSGIGQRIPIFILIMIMVAMLLRMPKE